MHPVLDSSDRYDTLVYPNLDTDAAFAYAGIGKRHMSAKFQGISCGNHKDLLSRYNRRLYTACLDGWGLVIYGVNSIGKTCAAVSILKHAIALGFTGFFIETSVYLSAVLEGRRFDGSQSIQGRAEEVDILVLDDFGKQKQDISNGSWAQRTVEELLRLRSKSVKSTILTTNWNPKKWRDVMGESFGEIISETMVIVDMIGPNRRKDSVYGR